MAAAGRDDPATLVSIGVLAAIAASLAHEALGHGGACLASGGRITLLTSIFFWCLGPDVLTTVAGPLGGLTLTAAAGAGLIAMPNRSAGALRLALLFVAVFAGCWTFGQLMVEAVGLQTDDWALAARHADWPAAWRLVAGLCGATGYLAIMRLSAVEARRQAAGSASPRLRLLAPWAAAVIAMTIAGALWRKHSASGAAEDFRTFAIAPIGYGWAVWRVLRSGGEPERTAAVIRRDWRWIVLTAAVYLLFAGVLGQGVGQLA